MLREVPLLASRIVGTAPTGLGAIQTTCQRIQATGGVREGQGDRMREFSPVWRRSVQITLAVATAFLLIAATVVLSDALLRDRKASGGGPLGTQPPSVSLWTPVGGERWTGGTAHALVWQMTDDADPILQVEVFFRLDVNASWTLVLSGSYPTGTNMTFSWTLPSVDTGDAAFRVCATDSDGMTGCDESGAFAIDSTRPVLVATVPANGATGVPVGAPLIAQFNERMNVPSAEAAFWISPSPGGIVVAWSSGDTMVTVGHSPLANGTLYTWGFTCQARDASDPGNALEGCPRSSQFVTAGGGNGTLPDLTLSEADIGSVPANPTYGDQVTIYANVHNVGTEDAHNVSVSFYDNAICWADVIYDIGIDVLPHVPAGGSAVASVVWDTTASADGWDYIAAVADAWSTIPESDEGNNRAVRHIYVSNTPCEGGNQTGMDLAIAPSDIFLSDDTPQEGEVVMITAFVHNVGGQNASDVIVRFVDCPGGMPPCIPIADVVIPDLPAHTSDQGTAYWNATPPGGHEIDVIVDPFDTIPETNEGNNFASRWVFVGGAPGVDLAIASSEVFFSDDTPEAGQTIVITALVRNLGTQDAYNVSVRFADCYNMSYPPCSPVGFEYILNLTAGGVANVSAAWVATPPGNHTIVVDADWGDFIEETDETNNAGFRTVFVGPGAGTSIFVEAVTFDNDNDGRYDDVVILVYDSAGRAVEGASVYVDGVFYGLTPDTGLLVAYNFYAGTHTVLAILAPQSDQTTFVSEG